LNARQEALGEEPRWTRLENDLSRQGINWALAGLIACDSSERSAEPSQIVALHRQCATPVAGPSRESKAAAAMARVDKVLSDNQQGWLSVDRDEPWNSSAWGQAGSEIAETVDSLALVVAGAVMTMLGTQGEQVGKIAFQEPRARNVAGSIRNRPRRSSLGIRDIMKRHC
jgi:hypothetical protein